MRSRKIRPRWLMLGGLIGVGCGIAVTELCGQHPVRDIAPPQYCPPHPVHDRAPPPNILNYPCMPRRETWGYYSPKWRRWPEVTITGAEAPAPGEVDPGLPETDIPRPEQEEQRAPVPLTRGVPQQAAPSPEAEMPAPATPGGAGGAFQPTPAAEPPAGGGAEMPAAPLPSAPLPSTPFPGDSGQNGAGPQPAPAPSPLNPFEGFDGAEADPSQFQNDPPPALPPSLQSTLRLRDANRAAKRQPVNSGTIAGLTRLPGTSAAGSADRYAVQQASATVWASGTNDILPSDPNAGRIEQAIHHEPLK